MKWTQTRSWTHEGVAFHPAAPAQFGHYASKIHNPWARCIYFTRSYTVVLVSECWIGCGMYCMCMSLSVVVVTGWVGSANKKAGSTQFFDTGTPFQSLWLCSWPTGISDNFCNLASLQVINMRTSIVSFVRGGGPQVFLMDSVPDVRRILSQGAITINHMCILQSVYIFCYKVCIRIMWYIQDPAIYIYIIIIYLFVAVLLHSSGTGYEIGCNDETFGRRGIGSS